RDGPAVAAGPLAATPTRTRRVVRPAGVGGRVLAHDQRGGPPLAQQSGHGPHRTVDVVEERLEAGAQVVEARFTVRSGVEAVLGAAAVAGEADVAVEAVSRQGVVLVLAEPPLPR